MFSERAISAVPIIDEEGVVVNLYETVDVIVSRLWSCRIRSCAVCVCATDTGPSGSVSVARSHNIGGTQATLARFPRCCDLRRFRFTRYTPPTDREAACASARGGGRRGQWCDTDFSVASADTPSPRRKRRRAVRRVDCWASSHSVMSFDM